MAIDRELVTACADRAAVRGHPRFDRLQWAARLVRGIAVLFCVAVSMTAPRLLSAAPALAQAVAPEIRRATNNLAESLDLQTELPAASLEPEVSWAPSLDGARILLWIAVICGAATLAYYIRAILPAGGLARPSAWDDPSDPAALRRLRDGRSAAQVTADDLAQEGRYVEAMHVLLLQALDEMRNRLDQRFADSLTSREIMRRANVSADAKTALRDIIGWVERAYFGAHLAAAGDYAACRRSFVAFADALREATK
jgi:hypothetical protein